MTAKARFLKEYPVAVSDDAGAIFIGAGVSVGAGYPSWKDLLQEIGDELGVRSSDVMDLAALAQWNIRKAAGRSQIHKVIREQIAPLKVVPEPLEIIARLPVRNIWTTNYDTLIERAFAAIGRPLDEVTKAADLSTRTRPGAARLYKMHGTVGQLSDLVISTDDYELYRQTRGAFLPLLQSHLTSFSMLFIGLSLTDPNVRHVLSLIRETFSTSPPEHFAIVRPPHRGEYKTKAEFESRLTQHKLWSEDLLRYGLQVVEIDNYVEVPDLLKQVERRVVSRRVWISGSWPEGDGESAKVSAFSRAVGVSLGEAGYTLVSGFGLTVAPAALSGFLDALQRSGSWDLERRLIVRPFSQPVVGRAPNAHLWAALREDMARATGAVVFVGGAKLDGVSVVESEGVAAERAAADKVGAFLLPIGASGGTAKVIAGELLGSAVPYRGAQARRPTDAELKALIEVVDPGEAAKLVVAILSRFAGALT